jgi:hypothetical protein|nr:MAG TPA: hypothetical protein [Crassvirales sp.]
MNLVAYDEINVKVDKHKTWYHCERNSIISREVSFRKHYAFVKRYEPQLNDTIYFIVMLDNPNDVSKSYNTHKDNYGRLFFKSSIVFKELGFDSITKDVNISLIHVEHCHDGDVYKIDV